MVFVEKKCKFRGFICQMFYLFKLHEIIASSCTKCTSAHVPDQRVPSVDVKGSHTRVWLAPFESERTCVEATIVW